MTASKNVGIVIVSHSAKVAEGAVMAATEASGGSPLAVVQATAEELMSA